MVGVSMNWYKEPIVIGMILIIGMLMLLLTMMPSTVECNINVCKWENDKCYSEKLDYCAKDTKTKEAFEVMYDYRK